jgi:hypothetical protein
MKLGEEAERTAIIVLVRAIVIVTAATTLAGVVYLGVTTLLGS